MPKAPDKPAEVPGWIISFSDMITLLLAFFVLLQSFAYELEEGLFRQGQDSFKRAIDGLGVPSFLLGVHEQPGQNYLRVRHSVPETAEVQDSPVYDQRDEMIRERFQKIMQEMASEATDNDERAIDSAEGFAIAFDETGHGLTESERAAFAGHAYL